MSGISLSDFFKEKRDASEIKAEILNEYFKAWAAILLRGQKYKNVDKLLYIDLFSGPGVYDDGKESTPIKILNSINASRGNFVDYDSSVQTIFNDKSEKIIFDLRKNIESLTYYNLLKYKPIIGNELASQPLLEKVQNGSAPSLTFIDPLGYGYNQKMLLYSVRTWGSDLFVLFNINRIRAAILNNKVEKNMYGIFTEYFTLIQGFYKKERSPHKREKYIINVFEKIFEDKGYMTLKFKVNFPKKNQTSHYLFFVSRAEIAITKAKEIMTRYSDVQEDGVPLFGANIQQTPLFFPSLCEYSITKLKEIIIRDQNKFNGLTINEVYKNHNYKTNYVKQNYKDAFSELKDDNFVILLDINNKETDKITYTAKIKFI